MTKSISNLRKLLKQYQTSTSQNSILTKILKEYPELSRRKIPDNLSNTNIENIIKIVKGKIINQDERNSKQYRSTESQELISRLIKLQDFRFRHKKSYLRVLQSLSLDELVNIIKNKQCTMSVDLTNKMRFDKKKFKTCKNSINN